MPLPVVAGVIERRILANYRVRPEFAAALIPAPFRPLTVRGWAVGGRGTIIATRDGGRSWVRQNSGTKATLLALHMLPDAKRGWAVGLEGTIRITSDGGQTWQREWSPHRFDLLAVTFTRNGKTGWIVGGSGLILKRGPK